MSKKRFLRKALFIIVFLLSALIGKEKVLAQQYFFSREQRAEINRSMKTLSLLEKRIEHEKHGFSKSELENILKLIKELKEEEWSLPLNFGADFKFLTAEQRERVQELQKNGQELIHDLDSVIIRMYQFTIDEEKIRKLEKKEEFEPIKSYYQHAVGVIKFVQRTYWGMIEEEDSKMKYAREQLIKYMAVLLKEDADKLLALGKDLKNKGAQNMTPAESRNRIRILTALSEIGSILIDSRIPDLAAAGYELKVLLD